MIAPDTRPPVVVNLDGPVFALLAGVFLLLAWLAPPIVVVVRADADTDTDTEVAP